MPGIQSVREAARQSRREPADYLERGDDAADSAGSAAQPSIWGLACERRQPSGGSFAAERPDLVFDEILMDRGVHQRPPWH